MLMAHGNLAILTVSAASGLAWGAITSAAEGLSGAIGMATLLHSFTQSHSCDGRTAESDPPRINEGSADRQPQGESPEKSSEDCE
jgi:hypothetical protein